MRTRFALAALTAALVAGCGSPSTSAPAITVSPVDAAPAHAHEVTTLPDSDNAPCDREASLRPTPGNPLDGPTMRAITKRGELIVGVDQNTNLFGFRDPVTGELEGFDIDVARELARDIFGDQDGIDRKIVDLKVVDASQREDALQNGLVDVVVRTYSITCDRKQKVAFSTTYFNAHQKILALKDSGIDSAAALSGKRVCAVDGTTSLPRVFELNPRPTVFGVSTWTDCLVMLQQGQVDAISTDDVILSGMADEDPKLQVVGESMGDEPYGVGVKKGNDDLVRFVNGVLDRIRADGTWERLYAKHLHSRGPSPGPPMPRYEGPP
jgi:polar amino acid transport system substrate-binding protein